MKHLSNADFRLLYLRRQFLTEFMQVTALQAQSNLRDSWERSLSRIKAVRDEIKGIVDDPQFDILVSIPSVSRPSAESYSESGTIINVVATARELQSYIDGLLGLYLTPKTPGLQQNPKQAAKVFIGHGRSPVWVELKDFIQNRLRLPWDEFNREPTAGKTTKERLQEVLVDACFAFLVMTADDEHADGTLHARENVIHEVGLFQERLGFTKAIVLLEEGCQEFSNIVGITQIRFPKGNIMAKSEEIRRVLEREGVLVQEP